MDRLVTWISGVSLMKRWGMGAVELAQLVESGVLAAYWRGDMGFYGRLESENFFSEDLENLLRDEKHCCFRIEDVEQFEREHPELVQVALSNKDLPKKLREHGQLKKEKEKWSSSLSVAFQVGLLCAKSDIPLTRRKLADAAHKVDRNIPDTTLDRIWEAIPSAYRSPGGRPRKKKGNR